VNAKASVKHEEITDYAMPMMRIEKLMRELHDLCLKNEFGKALDKTPSLITEVRVLQASLAIMSEKVQ
jgi:hypothetical protein